MVPRAIEIGGGRVHPGSFIGREDPIHLGGRVPHPIGGPDADDLPPQRFEDLLAEAVPVAGGGRAVIGRPVAFDTQHEPPRMLRVDQGQVDPIPAASDLPADLQATGGQRLGDLALEGRIVVVLAGLGDLGAEGGRAAFGVVQVVRSTNRTGSAGVCIRLKFRELVEGGRTVWRVIVSKFLIQVSGL